MDPKSIPGAALGRLLGVFLARRGYLWMPSYCLDSLKKRRLHKKSSECTDLIICVADHFEPSRWRGEQAQADVKEWCNRYRKLVEGYHDYDGVIFQHTWFYRYDFPNYECLRHLSKAVFDGYGEIEFHLHHGYDTPGGFSEKIDNGLRWFGRQGAMLTAEPVPQRKFAYIAGDWALDNGRRNPAYSGVDTEISILSRYGCYADFTFPAYGETSQPGIVNQIYHTTDTPKAKSYSRGTPYEINKKVHSDLTIFQGPLAIDWKTGLVEAAALESYQPYSAKRLEMWRKAHVHVIGRPEWIFVKLHTHGMQSRDMFLGEQIVNMLDDLLALQKKGDIRVHFVTAREAFNIAKAAEVGLSGNPNQYRNFLVKPPINRYMYCNTNYAASKFDDSEILVSDFSEQKNVDLQFKYGPVLKIYAEHLLSVKMVRDEGQVWRVQIDGEGDCEITLTSATGDLVTRSIDLPFAGTVPSLLASAADASGS